MAGVESASKVAAKADGKCSYCGCAIDGVTVVGHWDHVVPVIRGGPDTLDNIVMACSSCNSSKGARLPSEWRPLLAPRWVVDIEKIVLDAYKIDARSRRARTVISEPARSEPVRSDHAELLERVLRDERRPLDAVAIRRCVERNADTFDIDDGMMEFIGVRLLSESGSELDWTDYLASPRYGLQDYPEIPTHAELWRRLSVWERLTKESPLSGLSRNHVESGLLFAGSSLAYDIFSCLQGGHKTAADQAFDFVTMPDDSMCILLWDLRGDHTADLLDLIELDLIDEWCAAVIHVDDMGVCRLRIDDGQDRSFQWHVSKRIPHEVMGAIRANWTERANAGGTNLAWERLVDETHEYWCNGGYESARAELDKEIA